MFRLVFHRPARVVPPALPTDSRFVPPSPGSGDSLCKTAT